MKLGYLTLVAFIATIPAANWLIGNFGTTCTPDGPCLLPVGFGLRAPSGVLVMGIALVLRDIVHERFGWKIASTSIFVGAVVSAIFASPTLAAASALAFLLSEFADLVVYAPLRKRRLTLAVVLSGLVGSIIDSAAFLLLAFGSLDFVLGQSLGKFWMTLLAVPILWILRNQWGLGCHHWHVHESYGHSFTEKCDRSDTVTERGRH